MLKILQQLFDQLSETDNKQPLSERDLNLAVAALLVEVATIDQVLDDREWQQLQTLLVEQCALTAEDAKTLAEEGKQASNNSTSLYDFTQLVNAHCEYDQKLALVSGLWKIAYADDFLDKYEEHIIRRIADLIHVSHKDFITTKIQVRDSK